MLAEGWTAATLIVFKKSNCKQEVTENLSHNVCKTVYIQQGNWLIARGGES